MVHLTNTFGIEFRLQKLAEEQNLALESPEELLANVPLDEREMHLCRECADTYFASTPGLNSSRGLICLSDWYRQRLYDQLESLHPEAFDNSDDEACRKGSEVMIRFLTEQLAREKLEIKGDAFEMLLVDFFGSHHFYTRLDEVNKRKRK